MRSPVRCPFATERAGAMFGLAPSLVAAPIGRSGVATTPRAEPRADRRVWACLPVGDG